MGHDIFYFPVSADGSYIAAEDELQEIDLDTNITLTPPGLHRITFNEGALKGGIKKLEHELGKGNNKQALKTLTALTQIMFEE